MKNYLFLFFLIGVTNLLQSQSEADKRIHKLIEIKQISDQMDRDTQLIRQYSQVVEELARHLDDRTEAYIDTLKNLVDETGWDFGYGLYYRAMGRHHEFAGDYEPVLDYYQKAIEAFKPAGGDLKELAFTYVLKGFFLSNSGLHAECWKVFEEGIPYARNTDYKNSLCLMLDWFGDYYYYGLDGVRDNEKALEYYLQVKEILPQISYHRIIADNYAVLSGVYNRLGRTEQAQESFLIADSLSENWNLPHVRWGLYAEKARVLEDKGLHLEANKIYLQTSEFMESSTNIEFKARLEKALWENYKNIGQYEKALHHYETMNEMESKMATDEVEKKYVEMMAKYDLALKEQEINNLQQSKLKSNRNLLFLLLGIMMAAGIIIWRKNRDLTKSYKELEHSQREKKEALYRGETQERQRIASELHDNVNTKLAASRWRLEAIAEEVNGPVKNVVDSTIEMLNEAYQDVRNVSHNLVPERLESDGLVGSISNLLKKLNASDRVNFSIESEIEETDKVQKVIYPVYNIIHELINNVMKHADASKSHISIWVEDNEIVTLVSDNGQGYDVETIHEGFGFRSIRSRVESLNGVLKINSTPGDGSSTEVRIPLG